MRQAGILAAAGLIALEQMTERLRDDHANATLLAQGIGQIAGLQVVNTPQTNMVYFDVAASVPFDATELCKRAMSHRVKMLPTGTRRIRAVTHAWVARDEITEAIQVINHAMSDAFVADGVSVRSY